MSFIKLHHFSQDLFHNRGICYWMCEFMMRTDFQNPGAWSGFSGKKYDELKNAAKTFTNYVACASWSKVKQNEVQQAGYSAVAGALGNNRLYRIWVCIDTAAAPQMRPNHEIMCITGAGARVLLFDPNFGFFEFDNTDAPAETNREVLERHLNGAGFYGETGSRAHSFGYRPVGVVKA